MDSAKAALTVIVIVSLVLIGGFGYLAALEERAWQEYAVAYHCHAVGKRDGSVGVGTAVGVNGQVGMVTTVQPDQTIYSCDNGEMRIR